MDPKYCNKNWRARKEEFLSSKIAISKGKSVLLVNFARRRREKNMFFTSKITIYKGRSLIWGNFGGAAGAKNTRLLSEKGDF